MLFLQIPLFFVSIIFFSLSISGYGKLINLKKKNNFFLEIFLGFIIISFIITLIHFFFKINLIISFLIFIFGLALFIQKQNIKFIKLLKKNNIFYLLLIFFLIPMFLSQKYHEDFGYYHLPYALAFLEEKIVFGFANIDKSYVYNSIWLNLNSIFFLTENNFNFLTLPSYLLYLTFLLFSISEILSKKNISISDYYLIVALFYFILKFTRISEFGVDLPAIIFSILSIYFFIKFSETDILEDRIILFYLTLIFSVFSIFIKLSSLLLIILPFYIYLKHFKDLKLIVFNYRFIFILLFGIIFLIQQFIYTGCILFPTNLTCLNVNWFNSDFLNLSKDLELVNKSYYHKANDFYSADEYLSNFTWFSFWVKRNFIEISEHFLTLIVPILFLTIFLKKKKKIIIFFKEKIFLYFFLITSLFFWLNFSPVYRFGVHLFVTLAFVIFLNFLIKKEFSKKIFIIFIAIFLIFNFSKNILRVLNEKSIFLGIKKIENKYLINETSSNKYANVYYPDIKKNSFNGWQGRLCWDIPFICSWKKNIETKEMNGYLFINKSNR